MDDTCHLKAKQKGTYGSHVSHPKKKDEVVDKNG